MAHSAPPTTRALGRGYPAIPKTVLEHPDWGPYLTARTQLVTLTAEAVRRQAGQFGRPECALPEQPLTPRLIEDIEIWRAATGVETTERRVLGPVQLDVTARTWQHALEKRLQSRISSIWADMLTDPFPEIRNDFFAV